MNTSHPLYHEIHRLFYAEGVTSYRQIGKRVGLSPQRVHQIFGNRREKVGPGDATGCHDAVEITFSDPRLKGWCKLCGHRWEKTGNVCSACNAWLQYTRHAKRRRDVKKWNERWREKNPAAYRQVQARAKARHLRNKEEGPDLAYLRRQMRRELRKEGA